MNSVGQTAKKVAAAISVQEGKVLVTRRAAGQKPDLPSSRWPIGEGIAHSSRAAPFDCASSDKHRALLIHPLLIAPFPKDRLGQLFLGPSWPSHDEKFNYVDQV